MLNKVDEIRWRMYETVRAESIAAQQSMQNVISWSMTAAGLIAAILSLIRERQTNPYALMFGSWLVAWALSIIGTSQYLGEVGRMLRAGFFARKIENKIYLHTLPRLAIAKDDMWETYLAQKGENGKLKNRLIPTYYMAAVGALGGLIVVHYAPFVMLYDSFSCPKPWWWLFPIFSSVSASLLLWWGYWAYRKKFPSS